MPTTSNTNPDIMTALEAPSLQFRFATLRLLCTLLLDSNKNVLKLIIIKPNLSKVWELEGSKHLLANLAWPVLLLKDLHQIEDLRML